jgi:hypothetical protein
MTRTEKHTMVWTGARAIALTLAVLALGAADVEAQNANRRGEGGGTTIDLSAQIVTQVRDYYASHQVDAEALPPGIRRRVAQGKPLPPGIAKKVAPPELQSSVDLPDGYELVEVGLDVVLVEVATNVVHDVLMDVIR